MKIFSFGSLDVFEDERGEIINMLPDNVVIKSAMYITGKAGSIRANHWHKKDSHYCYVISGVLIYQTVDEKGRTVTNKLVAGDCVYTAPLEKHRFIFETRGSFVALATEPRNHTAYEADTIREQF